MTNYKFVSYVI